MRTWWDDELHISTEQIMIGRCYYNQGGAPIIVLHRMQIRNFSSKTNKPSQRSSLPVSHAAVFLDVTGGALRDMSENGCEGLHPSRPPKQ